MLWCESFCCHQEKFLKFKNPASCMWHEPSLVAFVCFQINGAERRITLCAPEFVSDCKTFRSNKIHYREFIDPGISSTTYKWLKEASCTKQKRDALWNYLDQWIAYLGKPRHSTEDVVHCAETFCTLKNLW